MAPRNPDVDPALATSRIGDPPKAMEHVHQHRRTRMVEQQLIPNGINDPRVLEAFAKVPRHRFVPDLLLHAAYEDRPLPIGQGQTISQPFIVAYMVQALRLKEGEHVLEVGTGTGYETAVLCAVGARVTTIERLADLSALARARLVALGFTARFVVGDGSLGVEDETPFDAILVSAGAPSLPVRLVSQLRPDGGRMVIPVGKSSVQDLMLVIREKDGAKKSRLCSCAFVKLVGQEGWQPPAQTHAPN